MLKIVRYLPCARFMVYKKWYLLCLCLAISPTLNARTFYISPGGNDANRGSLEKPLRTISSGARRARPGDTVFVLEGTYRERITPARGGEKGKPVTYLAEPGKRVIVKGSEIWKPGWRKEKKGIFSARPHPSLFTDHSPEYLDHYNPLKVLLASTPYGRNGLPEYQRKKTGDRNFQSVNKQISYTCGQVFVEGKPFKQVPLEPELTPQTWWYQPEDQRLHIHFGQLNPEALCIEITTRRRLFAPVNRGLGHIIVDGFIFEHCGNQYPTDFWKVDKYAQKGAIGLEAGHHWVIRNNVIRYANTFAIDCGRVDRHTPTRSTSHHNRIEKNYIIDNGSAGILSYGSSNLIIQDNVILRNNSLHFSGPKRWEHAGIKCHNMVNGLIVRNYIADNPHSPGVWLDNQFPDSEVHQNIIHHNGTHGIFLEMSDYEFDRLFVTQNIIFSNGKNAVYIHDASGATFANNLLACDLHLESVGRAIQIKQVSQRTRSQNHSFYNNLILGSAPTVEVNYPAFRSGPQRFDYNLYGVPAAQENFIISAYSDQPSPWTAKAFNELIRRDIGAREETASLATGNKLVALSPKEWGIFWKKHQIYNDQNSRFLPEINLLYDRKLFLLTLELSIDAPKIKADATQGQIETIFELMKEDSQSFPAGPLQLPLLGKQSFRVWNGLPPCSKNELPSRGGEYQK